MFLVARALFVYVSSAYACSLVRLGREVIREIFLPNLSLTKAVRGGPSDLRGVGWAVAKNNRARQNSKSSPKATRKNNCPLRLPGDLMVGAPIKMEV